MKKLIYYIIIVASCSVSHAQQLPQYAAFHRIQDVYNPGATGTFDMLNVSLLGRYQWLGFNNDFQGNVAPRTSVLTVSNILPSKKVRFNPAARFSSGSIDAQAITNPKVTTGKVKHAVGLQLIADEYGAFRNLGISGTYAIHLPMNDQLNFSLGTRVGLTNDVFLSEKAQVMSMLNGGQNDVIYDDFIANGYSRMFLNISSGLYLYSQKFFFGISANQLTKDYVSIGSGTANFQPKMHFDLTTGYNFQLNQKLTMMPSVMVKYMDPSPLNIQGNMQFEYMEWLWLGIGYRHKDAIISMVGGNITDNIRIAYNYEYSLSRIVDYSSGSHEVLIGFILP